MCLFKKIEREIDHDMIIENRELIKTLQNEIGHISNMLNMLIIQVNALHDLVGSLNVQSGLTSKQAIELYDFAIQQRTEQWNTTLNQELQEKLQTKKEN